MENKKLGLDQGIIKKVKDFFFIHDCNTYPGSSGGVIVNKNNNLAIGIHKGGLINNNEENTINNVGIFLRDIYKDIIYGKSREENLKYKENGYILIGKNDVLKTSLLSLISGNNLDNVKNKMPDYVCIK